MDKHKKRRPSDNSKNVSHVPCKFFRQGVCQAADNCPFSHQLEPGTSATQVCKYFQKGNCKFGSKCALAHITPDGKRVGKKKNKAATAAPKTPGPAPASAPAAAVEPHSHSHSHSHSPVQSPPHAAIGVFAQSPLTTPLGTPLGSPVTTLARPNTTGSSRTSSFQSLFPSRSSSTSRSAIWVERPKNPMAFEGSAVTDDEDDSFEEDLVPGALSELLTPQERERRNSRTHEVPSTELWSTPRFHRSSFGTSQKPQVKVDPIGTPDIRG